MLRTLMNFGEYRVDRFFDKERTEKNFGFYICAQALGTGSRSGDAKHLLYDGLAQICSRGELCHLVGIYIDINNPDQRGKPAYLELKKDLLEGYFNRVLISEMSTPAAMALLEDLAKFSSKSERLELFTFQSGEPISIFFLEPCLQD